MKAVFATFIVATGMLGRMEAERRTADIEEHEQNVSSVVEEEFSSGTGTFLVHTRHKAFGSGLHPGDDLPPTICSKGSPVKYSIAKQLSEVQGSFGEIFLGSLVGVSQTPDRILKSVKYEVGDKNDIYNFDPMELLPLRLNLPFVSRIESVFHDKEKKKVWMMQPYYSGGDLFKFKVSSARQAWKIAKQFAYGLWQIQRSGFIYGDIKEENTFWVDNTKEQIVLADFGLVTPCKNAGKPCTRRFAGTIQYMAPDIISGNSYGFEVDWWAFGVLLMNLVNGDSCYATYRRTHQGDHVIDKQQTFNKVLSGKCSFPRNSPIMQKEYDGLRDFVRRISVKESFNMRLNNDDARARMQSESPVNHPVLSDPYFFKKDTLEVGWRQVCTEYYREEECTRSPSLGSLCTRDGSSSQQLVSRVDPQQTLFDSLESARDDQPQVYHAYHHTCGTVCSTSTFLSHYSRDAAKASTKMATVCDLIKPQPKLLDASRCNFGLTSNSPRRKCCKCLASQPCQATANCMKGFLRESCS